MFKKREEINIYCDESCHLENDGQRAMVFGSIRYPKEKVAYLSVKLRELKKKHHIYPFAETKWTTVSKSKEGFYLELLELFLKTEALKFRAVVFQNKDLHKLEHNKFDNQTYEDWYYKMFYVTLGNIIDKDNLYNIYLDRKNANSSNKIHNLEIHLAKRAKINKIQNILSHQSELIQLTDFLTGIVSYANRDAIKLPNANQTKVKLVETLKSETKLSLISTTRLSADKINIFIWEPNFNAT
ncbi:MAG: DUF3800 domain-containing protein [Fusobacterium sp.]|nr:DUF3800 domain-containing protein [Fusobacterium sp.]